MHWYNVHLFKNKIQFNFHIEQQQRSQKKFAFVFPFAHCQWTCMLRSDRAKAKAKVITIFYYHPQNEVLGQGNIFTPVCHSVHRGGVVSEHALQVVSQHALQRGCAIPACLAAGGCACSKGGTWSGGVCSQGEGWFALGEVCSQGVPGGDPLDGYCCGQYAFYWNAFLFFDLIACSLIFFVFRFPFLLGLNRPLGWIYTERKQQWKTPLSLRVYK